MKKLEQLINEEPLPCPVWYFSTKGYLVLCPKDEWKSEEDLLRHVARHQPLSFHSYSFPDTIVSWQEPKR
jgi:hypothetical protein